MNNGRVFLKYKKILVTGANGFLGRNLVAKLNSLGVNNIGLLREDFDIVDDDINTLERCDLVVHLAAYVNPIESWKKFDKCLSVNVNGTKKILDYALKNKSNVIYLNTYVYGIPGDLPIGESAKTNPNTPYGVSKLMGEQLCEFYANYQGINVTSLRLFNVYGDSSNENFLVNKIFHQYKNGSSEIKVFSENTYRDFVHVDDVVDSIICACDKMNKFKVFNIGSGESLSSRDIYNILNELVGSQLYFSCTGEERENDVLDIRADISKAAEGLNWTPKISMYEGIKRFINE